MAYPRNRFLSGWRPGSKWDAGTPEAKLEQELSSPGILYIATGPKSGYFAEPPKDDNMVFEVEEGSDPILTDEGTYVAPGGHVAIGEAGTHEVDEAPEPWTAEFEPYPEPEPMPTPSTGGEVMPLEDGVITEFVPWGPGGSGGNGAAAAGAGIPSWAIWLGGSLLAYAVLRR